MMRGHVLFLESTSSANKFISVLNRMSMKLHSKHGSFLRIEAKVLKRLHAQAVRAVKSAAATHSQKDSVEGNVGGSSAE